MIHTCHLFSNFFIILVLILCQSEIILATSSTSNQYYLRTVTDKTLLDSLSRKSSYIVCGSWCMATKGCKAFKSTNENCKIYSGISLKDGLIGDEKNIDNLYVDKHFLWTDYNPIKSTKALLFGGTGSGGVTQVATVIDLNTGKECDNFDTGKDPSLNWSGMSVGVLDRKYILACGGALGDANLRKTCEVLDGTTKTFQFELDQYRSANFIPFSDSVLWLTGSPVDKTTILVTKNGYVEGPLLPQIRFGHCGVRINKTTAMIIGGIKITQEPHSAFLRFSNYGGSATDSTYYYDLTSLSWSEGPTLKDALVEGFGCTVAMLGDEPTVFVTNGKHEDYGSGLEQVEYLKTSTNEWIYGPRTSSWYDKGSALFAHPDQSTLYRLGGNRFNKGFMTLNCKLEDCESCAADVCGDQWKVLSTSIMTIERKFPGFTLIPDEMASNCPICKTRGVKNSIDPQTALPCIIPWGYDHSGEKFYGCADNEPGHLPWCPTGVNDQGFYVSGSGTWGRCNNNCPMSSPW